MEHQTVNTGHPMERRTVNTGHTTVLQIVNIDRPMEYQSQGAMNPRVNTSRCPVESPSQRVMNPRVRPPLIRGAAQPMNPRVRLHLTPGPAPGTSTRALILIVLPRGAPTRAWTMMAT